MKQKEERHPIETSEPTKKKLRKPRPVQQATELAFKALIQQGLNASKASSFLGMHPSTGAKILKRLKEQGEETSAFLSPLRDEKLGRLVDHYLDKGIKLRNVKGSDALGAAKLYADRRYPVRQEQAPPVHLFVNIDLSEFRPDPPPEPKTIDLEPEPVDEPPEGTR